MATMTLLEVVQSVLSDMDSDEVNSISDTLESLQVAQIAKDTYYWMLADRDWPHLNQLFLLGSVSDTTRPNYLQIPSDVHELESVAYNTRKSDGTYDIYKELIYMYPDTFLVKHNRLKDSDTNITLVTDGSGVKFSVYNDRAPKYWTSFDDEYIVTDAYDSDAESTLQSSKTQCRGRREPTWTSSDTFTPDLPRDAFPTYLAEVKSSCFLNLKQVENAKAEQISQKGQRRLSRKSFVAKGGVRYPDYGRKHSKYTSTPRSPYFDKT